MVTVTENVKVIKVGTSLRIAIPVVFCRALGMREGNTLHLASTNGDILVTPLRHKEARKKEYRNPLLGPEKNRHGVFGKSGRPTNYFTRPVVVLLYDSDGIEFVRSR